LGELLFFAFVPGFSPQVFRLGGNPLCLPIIGGEITDGELSGLAPGAGNTLSVPNLYFPIVSSIRLECGTGIDYLYGLVRRNLAGVPLIGLIGSKGIRSGRYLDLVCGLFLITLVGFQYPAKPRFTGLYGKRLIAILTS